MNVRKASTTLQSVIPAAPLIERELPAFDSQRGTLEWQGSVRLAADRAAGISAARLQQHVRTGLLERALVLGSDHHQGPHLERPAAAHRLLAHIDALAEAGLSPAELRGFAEEMDLDDPGTSWVLTLLFGCLAKAEAADEFGAWIESLDGEPLETYCGVIEVADALRVLPSPELRRRARAWLDGSRSVPCAIALETTSLDELPGDALPRLIRKDDPFIQVGIERLLARSAEPGSFERSARPPWTNLPTPALAYPMARARMLMRDFEPIFRLRRGDALAVDALGPYALELIALAGDGTDQDLALDLSRRFPTSASLLDSMGRIGFPALFPRLLAELENDEFDEDAHDALVTALGPRIDRPSRQAWEQALATLPELARPTRRRGGAPHTPRSVLEEMKRLDLSAPDVRVRADELRILTGKRTPISWEAFGSTLEAALTELSRLVH